MTCLFSLIEGSNSDVTRTRRYRPVVKEDLPSQEGLRFTNKFTNFIKKAPTSKALKTNLKKPLSVKKAFYIAHEVLDQGLEPHVLKIDHVFGSGVNKQTSRIYEYVCRMFEWFIVV